MERIISDIYTKTEENIWGDNSNTPYYQRILAINDMYGWLYDNGVLKNVAFIFKDYEDRTYFALDVKDLMPYRKEMETSMIPGANIAVSYIFDTPYTPCIYSGAIELCSPMNTYREVDGCVGRSWECTLIKALNTKGIYEISAIRDEKGIKAAVTALYEKMDWNPTLEEKTAVSRDISASKKKGSLSDLIKEADGKIDKSKTITTRDYER